jgi:integrase
MTTRKSVTQTTAVLLTTTTADLGIVPASDAARAAKQAARQAGQPVTMRDPVSDKVIGTVAPTGRKLTAAEIAKRKREGAYHDGRLPLSAKRVQRLKGAGRYRDGLVPGLYLQITASGARSWLLRFELNGKERMMGLGSAAIFTLAHARERAREARRLLADRVDPLADRRAKVAAAKAAAEKAITFSQATLAYISQHESKWRSAAHRNDVLSSLKAYAFPIIGNLDVASIDLPDVLRVVEPHWKSKTVTMDRLRGRIESVLDWATARKHRTGDNPARWDLLAQILPAPRKVSPVVHHAAMDYREVPAFMVTLRADTSVAARAVEFLILCAARAGEARGAVWSEIDFDEATWTIPASRMKAGREHRVALSPAAVELVRALPRERDNPHVFIGSIAGRGLNKMSLVRVMDRLERRDVSIHGFRSAFSDWAHEQTAHSNHAIELALAHSVGSAVERSYRRTDMVAKRARLMSDWAKYCSTPPRAAGVVVVPIGGHR